MLLAEDHKQKLYLGTGAIADRDGDSVESHADMELNDLLAARTRYQSLAVPDPASRFALVGRPAARIAEVRVLAKPELERLAKVDSPTN